MGIMVSVKGGCGVGIRVITREFECQSQQWNTRLYRIRCFSWSEGGWIGMVGAENEMWHD